MQAVGRQSQRAPDGAPLHYEPYPPEQTTLYPGALNEPAGVRAGQGPLCEEPNLSVFCQLQYRASYLGLGLRIVVGFPGYVSPGSLSADLIRGLTT